MRIFPKPSATSSQLQRTPWQVWDTWHSCNRWCHWADCTRRLVSPSVWQRLQIPSRNPVQWRPYSMLLTRKYLPRGSDCPNCITYGILPSSSMIIAVKTSSGLVALCRSLIFVNESTRVNRLSRKLQDIQVIISLQWLLSKLWWLPLRNRKHFFVHLLRSLF